jgi:uncharacterized protein YuzE
MAGWPAWWSFELVLSLHAIERMKERGITEIDLRAMLADATGIDRRSSTAALSFRRCRPTNHGKSSLNLMNSIESSSSSRRSRYNDMMSERQLQITYRKGKPLAAYLFLARRAGDRSARTERFSESLMIDYAADGRAIGIEIVHPQAVTEADINRALAHVHESPLPKEEFAPLRAA